MSLKIYDFYSYLDLSNDISQSFIDQDAKPLEKLNGLQKINILVGSNNSGKSYLMRELIKNFNPPYNINISLLGQASLDINTKKSDIVKFIKKTLSIDPSNINTKSFQMSISGNISQSEIRTITTSYLTNKKSYKVSEIQKLYDDINEIRLLLDKPPSGLTIGFQNVDAITLNKKQTNEFNALLSILYNVVEQYIFHSPIIKIYVHYLRSLVRTDIQENSFSTHVINKYNLHVGLPDNNTLRLTELFPRSEGNIYYKEETKNSNVGLAIHTGQDIFKRLSEDIRTIKGMQRINRYCQFLSENFLIIMMYTFTQVQF